MSSFQRAWMLAVPLLTSACGPGRPAVRDAEAVVMQAVGSPSPGRIEVGAFRKTDGRAAELAGVALYSLMFEAEAQFLTDALYALDGRSSGKASALSTSEYVARARAFSWGDALNDIQGRRPARRGDVLHLVGEVTFERRESGWIATGLSFTARHDSSTRAVVTETPTAPNSEVRGATAELRGDELAPGMAVGRIQRLSNGVLCVGDFDLSSWVPDGKKVVTLSDPHPVSGFRTLRVPGGGGYTEEWMVHPDSSAPLTTNITGGGKLLDTKSPPQGYAGGQVPEHLRFERGEYARCPR